MSQFHTVKLELVRPGPAHNQLLSPLTSYIALCGNESPVTIHIQLEHHKLLRHLDRLRYVTPELSNVAVVPDRIREATVREVGEEVARIFAEIPTLLAEISRGRGTNSSRLAHLNLVLGGSELALVPFELALSPQSFPGEGLEFLLQVDMGTVITRETRRSRSAPEHWDRPVNPAILLIASMPDGMDVPVEEHLDALRAAIEPWVRWPISTEQDRMSYIKEQLRVLINPSIQDIYELCSEQQFTHIHILAHGDSYEVGGERRFGVALCEDGNPAKKQVVSGTRLAKALQAESEDGQMRSRPTLVTLATCDSGNQQSVLIPGGSIAHDLHSSGIPWVFASQFPLTKRGSVRLAWELYPRLMRGDDPRQVLFELRRKLFMEAERDHDWASIVVYAAIPSNFDDQVWKFFERQTKRAVEIALDRMDGMADGPERSKVLKEVMKYMTIWEQRLPEGDDFNHRSSRADYFGMNGAVLKRIALYEYEQYSNLAKPRLEQSLSYYRRAMEEGPMDDRNYHWVATQVLSLSATLGEEADSLLFDTAHHLASRNMSEAAPEERAWTLGTLAELELLRSYHKKAEKLAAEEQQQKIKEYCKQIVALRGFGSFEVAATRRQFVRYVYFWNRFVPLAQVAVDALTGP